MNNFSTMKVFKSLSNLIDDIPHVNIFEYILRNDIVKVSFNKLKDEINISVILCFDGIIKFDDVGVINLLEYLDLTISSLCICGMLKGIKYFFECKYFFSVFFLNFPDMAVSSRTNFLHNCKSSMNMIFNVT